MSFELKDISIESIHNGELAEDLAECIRQAVADVDCRWNNGDPREISLNITIQPNLDYADDDPMRQVVVKGYSKVKLPPTKHGAQQAVFENGKLKVNVYEEDPNQTVIPEAVTPFPQKAKG